MPRVVRCAVERNLPSGLDIVEIDIAAPVRRGGLCPVKIGVQESFANLCIRVIVIDSRGNKGSDKAWGRVKFQYIVDDNRVSASPTPSQRPEKIALANFGGTIFVIDDSFILSAGSYTAIS